MYHNILIVTAVEVEKEAVLRGLQHETRFDVLAGGVGPVAAAASTATAIAKGSYDLVISMGIGGGFKGKAPVGSLAVSSEIIAADLGVESEQGFSSIDTLGFGSSRIEISQEIVALIEAVAHDRGIPIITGPILTISTVTGTAETALEMEKRVPGAVAEAMEGFGVAVAAKQANLPIIEIRGISNLVGPRDRDAWRIKDALAALERVSSLFKEAL